MKTHFCLSLLTVQFVLFPVIFARPSLLPFYQPSGFVSSPSKQQNASCVLENNISDQSPAMSHPNPCHRGTTDLSGLQHSASDASFSNMQLGSQLYFRSSILCPLANPANPKSERRRATWHDPFSPIINVSFIPAALNCSSQNNVVFSHAFPSASVIRVGLLCYLASVVLRTSS